MTRVDIERLEGLHQNTTPGPWELSDGGWGVYVLSPPCYVWMRDSDAHPDDAEFVVEVHRELPALVAELRAAREELRAWRMVGELAKRHECSADYQRTIWAAINAIDERAGT